MPEVSERDLRRLSAETLLDLRTVAKAYGGGSVALSSREALSKAAEALGLPVPPPVQARKRGAEQ